MSCLECGERRRLWGAYCGPCFRTVNGVVKVEAPPLVIARHLRYDIDHHRETNAATREAKSPQARMFPRVGK